MILRRLAATVAATALLAGTAWAQSSALPYADTSPNSTPTIPFGGIHTPTNSGKVATAASLNNAQDVLSYITDGESPNEADYQGRTAFMYAAMSNNTLITRILLDHGGRTELKDRLGNTALHYAAQRGSVDVMRLLLSANAPIDAQNREGVPLEVLIARLFKRDHTANSRYQGYWVPDAHAKLVVVSPGAAKQIHHSANRRVAFRCALRVCAV